MKVILNRGLVGEIFSLELTAMVDRLYKHASCRLNGQILNDLWYLLDKYMHTNGRKMSSTLLK